MLPIYSSTLSVWAFASSVCGALVLGNFALLWLPEVLGRNNLLVNSRDGPIGKDNEALDECHRRFYAKSRAT
jgi:hypothetical protein